jgi:mono/diheme cytochrome c family protein
VLTLLILSYQNCGRPKGIGEANYFTSSAGYSELDQKIFKSKCLSCHSSGSTNFSSYSALMAGGSVVAGNPAASALYQEVSSGRMPKNFPMLAENEIQAIYDWIADGALNDVTPTLPIAPSSLAAAVVSSSQINLLWADNSSDETGFKILRATNSAGPFTTIATVAANSASYASVGLSASTTYYYKVYAFNSLGDSTSTNQVSATTQAIASPPPTGAPATPTNVTAAATSITQINLSWTDASSNETGFKIERSATATGVYTLLATLGPGVTAYSHTGLTPVSTNYYRVYAYNSSGNSANSNTANATTWGTFSWINTNITQSRCLSCHSGTSPDGGYNMATYTGVMKFVVSSNAASSRLYTEVNSGSMPDNSTKLPQVQIDAIRTWINSGAPNN